MRSAIAPRTEECPPGVSSKSSVAAADTGQPGTGVSILLMEDQELVRFALAQALSMRGFQIFEASNGREGLDRYRQVRPDVVIADIGMPEIDGLEATLRLTEEFPDAKVIAMSGGFGDRDCLKVARFLGATRTLRKPFEMTDLLTAIRGALSARSVSWRTKGIMEQRKFPRFSIGCSVKFVGDGIASPGRVRNISLGGCAVESAASVPRNSYLALQLYVPDADEPLVVQVARVAWSTGREFGVEFIRLSETSRQLLRQVTQRLEAQASENEED